MGKIFLLLIMLYFNYSFAAQIYEFDILKNEGNEAVKAKKSDLAVEKYSMALELKRDAIVYRNRGIVYFNQQKIDLANSDFMMANKLTPKDVKTLFWLGKVSNAKGKLTRAIYYLDKADALGENDDVKALLKNVENKILSIIEKGENIADFPPNLVAFHLQAEKLGIKNHEKTEVLQSKNFERVGRVNHFLQEHWEQENYVPLNRQENPMRLAEFIGSGKKVATVIVQGLPLHLSKSFNKVSVFDTSKEQIDFQEEIFSAIKQNEFSKFKEEKINKFISFVGSVPCVDDKKNPVAKPSSQQIRNAFYSTYNHLDGYKFNNNITSSKLDIFDALAREPTNEPHDVVFLSTIPSLYLDNLVGYCNHIREWLLRDKTVVFTLMFSISLCPELLAEYNGGFDDIAKAEFVMFDESPSLVHIKLSPIKD